MNDAGIRRFWDWFRARANQVQEDPGRHGAEISEMVDRLGEGLAWEIGRAGDGIAEFILRTEEPELRLLTREIISAAPPMAGWRLLNWRSPDCSADSVIEMEGAESLQIGTCSAEISIDPQFPVLHVSIVSPFFSGEVGDAEKYAGYLLLDGLLGEKLVEDAVDEVEFRSGAPGPVAIVRFRDEVVKRLAEARARSTTSTDRWMSLEGSRDGKPAIILLAGELDPARMADHPWRLDVGLQIKEPNGAGLPDSAELETMRGVEDGLIAFVEAKVSAIVWTHRTHDGVRTTSFYLDRPEGLGPVLREWLGSRGYEASVKIYYDARWHEYRSFLPDR